MTLPLVALGPLLTLALTSVILLLPAALRKPRASAILAALGFLVTGGLLWPAWQVAPVRATDLLTIDHYALVVMGIVTLCGWVVTLLGHEYFSKRQAAHKPELYLLLVIASLGGAVLAAASHFATLFLGVELLGISTVVLVAFPYTRPALEAGIKYLLLSGAASAFLVFGMALVYAGDGTLVFTKLAFAGPGWVGLVMILAGLAFKLSWVPFHLWAGDVYQGAPAPIAGFLGSASKVAAMAVTMRMLLESGAYRNDVLVTLFIFVACFSILTGNWLALLQQRIKRLLAYSAIGHFGFLLVLPATATRVGAGFAAEATLFYLLAYSLAVLVSFGLIAVLSAENSEADELSDLRGLFHHQPVAAVLFTVALLSLAGLPLTIGFVGKFYLFTAAIGGGLWLLALVMVFGSGLGMFYYLRVIYELGRPQQASVSIPAVASLTMLGVLGLLLLGVGVYPTWIMEVFSGGLQTGASW